MSRMSQCRSMTLPLGSLYGRLSRRCNPSPAWGRSPPARHFEWLNPLQFGSGQRSGTSSRAARSARVYFMVVPFDFHFIARSKRWKSSHRSFPKCDKFIPWPPGFFPITGRPQRSAGLSAATTVRGCSRVRQNGCRSGRRRCFRRRASFPGGSPRPGAGTIPLEDALPTGFRQGMLGIRTPELNVPLSKDPTCAQSIFSASSRKPWR